jgi:hypothetical protein
MKKKNRIRALIAASCFSRPVGIRDSKDVLAAAIIKYKMIWPFSKK